jgi:hypothetical protein
VGEESKMPNKRITVEPLSLRLRGFTVGDLLSKEFIDQLKKELPNAVIGHISISFEGTKETVHVSHDEEETTTNLEYVDIDGYDPKLIQGVARTIEKVIG